MNMCNVYIYTYVHIYIYMCVCVCVCVIQGFDKSISATAFVNSCQNLQFNLSIMHENIQIQKILTATKRQDTTKNRKQNINPFNHQIYKMVKYTQTICLLLLSLTVLWDWRLKG